VEARLKVLSVLKAILRPYFRGPYKTVTREVWGRAVEEQKQASNARTESTFRTKGTELIS